jgi:vitamin B12 transporter
MKKTCALATAALICVNAAAQQSTPVADSNNLLSPVVITATKFRIKQNETGKVLNVISREQLSRSAAKTVSEVLNQQAGVLINGAYNNLGANQTVYLQGASIGNTLILLDGVPLNDASGISSEFDLNTFAIDQIERIEILKGAQSTLYGADAVAGVINIISRKDYGDRTGGQLQLVGGSFGTYRLHAGVFGRDDELLDYSVSYSRIGSRGFSAAYDSTRSGNFEKDRFAQDAFNAHLGFAPMPRLRARVYAKLNINRFAVDAGAFADNEYARIRNANLLYGTYMEYALRKGSLHLHLNSNLVDRHYDDDRFGITGNGSNQSGRYAGRSLFVELYGNHRFNTRLQLLAGADLRRNRSDQSYRSDGAWGPFESKPLAADTTVMVQYSAYASLFYKARNGFNTELGGRINHHSFYGNNATFSFNPSYTFRRRWMLFANISSGYRVPSLYQLYSEFGNSRLLPEKSVNFQGGISYTGASVRGRVLFFSRGIRQVITFFTDPVTYAGIYINQEKQQDHGAEAELTFSKGAFSANLNYTYLDGEISTKTDAGKDTTFNNLFRRPRHCLNFSPAYRITQRLLVSAQWRLAGKSFEPVYGRPPAPLAAYSLLGIYGEYNLLKRSTLFLDIQNLTDELFFDQLGFTTRPRSFNVGFQLNF